MEDKSEKQPALEKKKGKPVHTSRIDQIFALPEAVANPDMARKLAYSSTLSVEAVRKKLT